MVTDRRKFLSIISLLPLGLPGVASAEGIKHSQQLPFDHTEKKFPLYVFSKVLQWIALDKLPSSVKGLGFDGIDLTVRPGGHIEPKDVKKNLPRLVEQCKNEVLHVPMLTTGILDANEEYTRAILETASKVGIKVYRLGWYKYDVTRSIDDQVKEFTEKLNRIAELNKEYGISGNYQNHSGMYFGASIWDLNYSLKQIGVPKNVLGVQFDIRHAMVEGTNSWMQDFKSISSQVSSLVIKDFCWTSKNSTEPLNVPIGEGMIDFSSYFSMLEHMKIIAPVSIHYEYALGGAESGQNEITISKEVLVDSIKKDRKLIHQMTTNN